MVGSFVNEMYLFLIFGFCIFVYNDNINILSIWNFFYKGKIIKIIWFWFYYNEICIFIYK